MRRITTSLIFSIMAIMSLTNCQNKKTKDGTIDNTQEMDQATVSDKKADLKSAKSYNSYAFAENLKNDNFFESDNIDKVIKLKDIGIITYFVSGDEVVLGGVFYDKQKNMAIPYNNRPPGDGAFVTQYYDKLEMKYDEDYKRTYSAGLRITLKDPKSVKNLKMYLASESSRVYEYQIDGGVEPEYRMGFIDLVNIKGTFKGISASSSYPEKDYEIINAEIY